MLLVHPSIIKEIGKKLKIKITKVIFWWKCKNLNDKSINESRKISLITHIISSISLTNIKWKKSLSPKDRMESMAVDAEVMAGGLLCLWDPEVFQLSECCSNRNFILLSSKLYNSFDCVIVYIYAPTDVIKRRKLWVTLLNLIFFFPKP